MTLAELFERLVGATDQVRFMAYDGSSCGPVDAPATIDVRSPVALRYLATAPDDLGLARAYVTGNLDVRGDLHAALTSLLTKPDVQLTWHDRAEVLRVI